MPFGLYPKSYHTITEVFQSTPEVEEVIIYGSRAMRNYKKGSDIDLALKGKNLTADIITKLSTQLNQVLPVPYHIDIADYNKIENEELRKHIDDYGKEFYRKKCGER